MAHETSAHERTLADRYRLGARRGTGVEVAVFDALDLGLSRPVVVKVVHPDLCAASGFADRFRAVMQRAASIDHPNVARVIDWGPADWNGRPVLFVVTDVLEGGSLRDVLDRGRVLSPSQAVVIGLDACRGLVVAHRLGLVHGDVRPANLVFGADGRLRLIDLGLAGLIAESMWADPSTVSLERATYASPEHATNQPPDPRGDVYSLCLTLVEAITGAVPFLGDSTVATLANRVDRLLPVSADLGPLASVLERAGRPDLDTRSTAGEFGKALVQAAEKLPRPAPLALAAAGLFAELAPNAPVSAAAPAPTPASAPAPPVAPPPPSIPAPPTAAVPVLPRVPAPVDPSLDAVRPSWVAADPAGPGPVWAPTAPAPAPLTVPAPPRPLPPDGTTMVPRVAPPSAAAPTIGMPTSVAPPPPPAHTPVSQPTAVAPVAAPAPTAIQPIVPPPPPRDESQPILRVKRSRRRLIAVTLVVLLVAGLGGGAAVWWSMRDRRHVVPALIGLDKGEALNQISTFGWKTTVVEEANETVPIGIVVRTDPGAGAKLGESAEFRVIASAGPAPRALPELRGATFEAASLTLTQLGLQVTTADQVNDEDVPPGVVISWKVPAQPGLVAGATVVKGTTVAVVLSAGPKERTVPDLSGLTLADATAKLQVVKLVVAQGDDVFSAKIPIGAVAAQDPPAGQQVPRGATVTVSLSKGPDLVTVPPLADLTVQQVTDALAAAGLKLGKVKGDPAGLAVLAEVKGASIGADATEPRGTAIDVTFQVPPPPTTTVDPNATTTTAAPA